jgi:hypothetical protein
MFDRKMFEGPAGKKKMIAQGYVPSHCALPDAIAGPLIYGLVNDGMSPCTDCGLLENGGCEGKVTPEPTPTFKQRLVEARTRQPCSVITSVANASRTSRT